jgi:SAM-dependent methyltransferase
MMLAQEAHDRPIRAHNAAPAAIWSSGGAAYDEISRGILDAIEHAVNRADVVAGKPILDLAAGTGWTARRLAALGAEVTALDFAPDMLAAALALARAEGRRVRFVEGDVEATPFPDRSFEAVVSTFGVIFAQRPEDAAAELARICRPGGRLVLAVWTPDGNVFEMFKIIKSYMPPPNGAPPPSPFDWGRIERLEELLGGPFDLSIEAGTSFYREPDGAAAWRSFVEGYGPVRALAGKLDPERRAQFAADFTAFHDRFADGLGITVPRTYRIVRGIRR